MENINTSAFKAILGFEQEILNTKKITASELDSTLHQLSDFRKDTYAEYTKTLNENNTDVTILFEEYDQYCNFILELLSTKTLSNASWSRILNNFAREYDLIKPYDSNNFAYNATLSALEYLSETLSVSDAKTSDYRYSFVDNLITQFSPDSSGKEKEL